MDWPIDMPFPVFYKKWQVHKAKLLGVHQLLGSKGTNLNWDTVRKLFKEAQQSPGWTKCFMENTKDQNSAALVLEYFMINEDCRTFILSRDLIEALKKTQASNVPEDLIKIPFDLIYIDISASPVKLNAPNRVGDSVRGIVVPSYRQETLKKLFNIQGNVVSGILAEHAPGETDGPGGPVCNWNCEGMWWRSENGIFQKAWDGGNIASSLAHRPDLQEIWNLWINALLYINSVNADIREESLLTEKTAKIKGKKGKARRRIKQLIKDSGKVFRVGHCIHLPQISNEQAKAPKGGKVSVRFMVRGHWHTFWTGSNRFGTKKQILKWVAPYWKGPETADVVHGTYIVKSK